MFSISTGLELVWRLPISRASEVHMTESAIDKFCDWVRLIEAEFSEMPGLHLSKRQAQRLWNLDSRSTEIIFEALEASRFLKRKADDTYIRADISY